MLFCIGVSQIIYFVGIDLRKSYAGRSKVTIGLNVSSILPYLVPLPQYNARSSLFLAVED